MKRILVVATRQIGDVLLTTPLIRAARQQWPQARIEVLGFAGTLDILAGNPDIDQCITTPHRLGWSGTWRLARQLWSRYDLALISQPSDRAHLIGWIAGRQRSGLVPEIGGSIWWKRALLRHAVMIDGDRGQTHVVREKLRLLDPWLAAAQRQPAPADPSLADIGRQTASDSSTDRARAAPAVVPPAAQPLPVDLASAMGEAYVVVHAPSMWAYKQWPTERYVQVVQTLLAEGHQVVLTGSASARDQSCIAPLRALGQSPALIDTSGRLGFGQLRTLLEAAALYIGPDTSVSHLAAACGTPMVVVFGPTNPQRWAPWPAQAPADLQPLRHAPSQTLGQRPGREPGQGHGLAQITLLQGPQSCVPCGRAGCEDHHHSRSQCLWAIDAATVLRVIRKEMGL